MSPGRERERENGMGRERASQRKQRIKEQQEVRHEAETQSGNPTATKIHAGESWGWERRGGGWGDSRLSTGKRLMYRLRMRRRLLAPWSRCSSPVRISRRSRRRSRTMRDKKTQANNTQQPVQRAFVTKRDPGRLTHPSGNAEASRERSGLGVAGVALRTAPIAATRDQRIRKDTNQSVRFDHVRANELLPQDRGSAKPTTCQRGSN